MTRWAPAWLGLALVLWGTPVLAAAPSCPPGRFFVDGGARVLAAGRDVGIDAVVLDESGMVSIASGCPSVPAKAKKGGKKLRVSWPRGACTGVPGKAKLSVRFSPGCEALSGRFSAKKLKAKLTATRSEGLLLEGDPGDPALPALLNLPPMPAASDDIVGGLILTRLDVGLAADATVGQVNAALAAVNGRIDTMRAGLPAVTVAVPRQSGPDALEALSETLEALPGIRVALLARDAKVDEAPPAPADAAIGYLQDARFPAAWNARAAAGNCADKVTVIVADKFHRPPDPLYADFATQVPDVIHDGIGAVPATDRIAGLHGYDVLTTLAAALDATVPTGANPFPECLDVRAVQIHRLDPFGISSAIDDALLQTSGKTVVNASFGFNDGCGDPSAPPVACTAANLTAPRALDRACWGAWQRRLLAPDVHDVLVTSAAGNEASLPVAALYAGAGLADYNSALNVAATADSAMSFVSDAALWEPSSSCQPDPCPSLTATPDEVAQLARMLVDVGQESAPPASNVVIVGSSASPGTGPSAFSDSGADVFAVGQDIPTLLGTPTQGTSFAAPQVAGLAAYLWMLSPELRARPVGDTIAAIEGSVQPPPSILIDAYAAVLSLDPASAVTPATAKMRLALLDPAPGPVGDGSFDASDLQAFRDAYVDSGPVPVQDFSRFDLNGDGFTGGSQTHRFDLDPTGSVQFGAAVHTDVTLEVAGEERTFDEAAVTDADVLCFYANTPLYTGEPDQRETILEDLGCGEPSPPSFAGTVTETFVGADGGTTVNITETYDIVLELKPDGDFETSGSARLLAVIDRTCEPGSIRQVLDASVSDPPGDIGDLGSDEEFAVGVVADVEGTNTEIGSGGCEENFVEPFETRIDTAFLSTPELVDGRVVALVWDAEAEAVDPFGFQVPGTLRVTGRAERVD